ncbi:oxygenase MpaB family protein [Rhodococcoides yunnanense]|uniref:oxygenase MpaB family protein n=1 Tax=Rhodococcoides yunnanense TaxID=278209 RepID=UPI000933B3E0|nr:oxygenase MpaB family protein [Rhodococcus yunnanensis]
MATVTNGDKVSGDKEPGGNEPAAKKPVEVVLTKERLLGKESRWRRFGEPVPAGGSLNEDGTPDYGLFGPGSVVWEVLLHPATIVFHNSVQAFMQTKYKPIHAGIRDRDPIVRKGRAGTLTFFDSFERLQRNAGMHAPMWLGDTATAKLMAKHLHNIHKRVAGDVIDVGEPELGGYAASEPRDAMWAALTEMHPMLRVYEAFAFRGGKLPRRLPAETRDQFMLESSAYVRLHGVPVDDEIPTTMAELAALYEKYDELFGDTETMNISPDAGDDYQKMMAKVMIENFHISQVRAIGPLMIQAVLFQLPTSGLLSRKVRQSIGQSALKQKIAVLSSKLVLPIVFLMQQPPIERYFMRLMWGPDGVHLIESARALHKQALADRSAATAA